MSIVPDTGHQGHGPGPRDGAPSSGLMIGLDVGSTAVKAVVMDPATDEILWKAYARHQSKQPEKVAEFLRHIEDAFTLTQGTARIFITGSGSRMIAKFLGAKFVQEVNAVSLAVEQLEPDTGSVIELGGQDAKIIIWFTDEETGAKRKVPSMNDKCAGGTGAVIDKINAKLQLSNADLQALEYFDVKLHPVAGKCGVFAETDIIGLQKQGVPPEQLMASLFEALVQQNLSVLTRGSTLRPKVLLLGGPNTFIPAVRDCWKHNIPKIWEERNTPLPEGVDPKDLIVVPENAEYYAAIGSVLFGKGEDADVGMYQGTEELEHFIEVGRTRLREASGDVGLWRTEEELAEFKQAFAKEPWRPASFLPGREVRAFIGIDGGSTSTKGVLMDPDGNVLATAYQLSKGNPLADSQDILKNLREHVEDQGATLSVLGVGTTGYAKDMLKEALAADVAIVETVAHTKSALHYYDDVDVIVDVGGQDIKVIVLSNGKVKDFKLNTQCSAGNGYFLQNTAERFGYSVEEYADVAFSAERLPVFNFGCAVFMETDIVNFQQMGWEKKEIMAGLANVLPKNIWLYVVAEPNLGKFGSNFVLQGGTQHNLAAVKAQYDFIKSKVPGVNIRVHRFTGESGAIGAALEAIRAAGDRDSTFIGLAAAENLEFTTTRDESTRCNYCKNTCLRTFVDTRVPGGDGRRFIIATCEKGAVEKVENMRVVKARLDAIKKAYPNFVERASEAPFRSINPPKVSTLRGDSENAVRRPTRTLARFLKRDRQPAPDFAQIKKLRRDIKIGIPRALNMYSLAPFFRSYFEALGVGSQNIIFSEHTSPLMWFKGSRRGSIDQCFPSKSVIAHVHNLMFGQRERNRPDIIFFPILRKLPADLPNAVDNAPCPSVSITPDVVRAAFTKEGDVFAENGIQYVTPGLDMKDPALFQLQMYGCFAPLLGVTAEESNEAIDIAFQAWRGSVDSLRREAREVLERLEEEGRVGVVMLGRPYHSDPGLSHEIMAEVQLKGYTVFTIDSLPRDEDILERLFGDEVRAGVIRDPMDIDDVWKNSFSQNTNRKVWAAKYVARHPNLVAIDLSNFKCGHDAPVYSVVEGIIEASGTPYFTFHDIDENKPTGSIKIRVETIDYFLQRYQEQLQRQKSAEGDLQRLVAAYKTGLRRAAANSDRGVPALAATNGFGRNGHDVHPPDHGTIPHPNGTARTPAFAAPGALGSNGNGNGHQTPPAGTQQDFPGHNGNGDYPPSAGPITPNGHNGNGKHSDAGRLMSAYDRIRALNTAEDQPKAEIPNASAGCGQPGRDYPPPVSPQRCQCQEEPAPPGDCSICGPMAKLVNLKMPHGAQTKSSLTAHPVDRQEET